MIRLLLKLVYGAVSLAVAFGMTMVYSKANHAMYSQFNSKEVSRSVSSVVEGLEDKCNLIPHDNTAQVCYKSIVTVKKFFN